MPPFSGAIKLSSIFKSDVESAVSAALNLLTPALSIDLNISDSDNILLSITDLINIYDSGSAGMLSTMGLYEPHIILNCWDLTWLVMMLDIFINYF